LDHLPALFGWRAGAASALAVCLLGLALDGRSATTDAFRAAALVFFAALTAVALIDPTTPLHHFVPALIPATLAVAAFLSILAGRPFTVAFAQRVAPREFWDTPLFARINLVLTAVWAVSFGAMAIVIASTLALAPQATIFIVGAQIAGFVVPMRITRSYPARARTRYVAA
jgi:hypothetical protein